MKRFHIHVSVADLADSIRYYSALFAAQPTVVKDDYAKWALDDPLVNFAISRRGDAPAGVDHLGIQVDSEQELAEMKARLASANLPMQEQIGTSCCYAKSDKYWSVDPQGLAWESFQTLGTVPVYGQSRDRSAEAGACCAPAAEAIAAAPKPTAKPTTKPTTKAARCAPGSSCC